MYKKIEYLPMLTLLFAYTAQAQTSVFQIEEVIVTAEKRAASLQETPLSIIAMSGDVLENSGVENTLDLRVVAPGVVISTNTATAQIFIRGVGTNFGGEQSVAFHVDGVYQVSPQGAMQDFLDVERVEILKGPQGTLYGRNATAGVINVITKRPSFDLEFEGDLQYGNYNKFRQRAMVNVPVVADTLALRASFLNSDRDGYRKNPYLGDSIDDENHYSLRGQLLFTPTEKLKILLSGDYNSEDSSRSLGFKINKNVFAPQVDLLPNLGVPGGTVPDDIGIVYSDKKSVQSYRQYGGSLDLEYDMGFASLNLLSAYRKNIKADDIDIDGTEVAYLEGHTPRDNNVRWFSQEARISGQTGALDWVAGLYYIKDKRQNRGTFELPVLVELGVRPGPIHRDSDEESEAYAAFVQGGYNITDQLKLTIGGRYSHDKKKTRIYRNANIALGLLGENEHSWNAFTPKLGIDYQLNDDVMLYAGVTKGFKAGGFSGLNQYAPEYIWSYEAGLRSTFWDKRARFNVTAFYYDYTDIQVNQILSAPDPVTGSTTTISNAATAEVKGLEIDLVVSPIEGLQLGTYASVLDAKYKNYIAPNAEVGGSPLVDLSGHYLPRAPKLSLSFSAQYTIDLNNKGSITIQGDLYHQSQIFFTVFNNLNDSFGRQKAYQVLNARIGYDSPDERWNVGLYARNITNAHYKQNVLRALGFYGQLDLYAPPRTYGVQAGWRF